MSDPKITGGGLCGAMRYEADAAPRAMGYCCCDDCQKASGSGFVPFMAFAPGALKVTGPHKVNLKIQADGRRSERYRCAACGSLVFGGEPGNPNGNTIYAGTLDDTSLFKPAIAIMTKFKPDWVVLPAGLQMFEGVPS